MSSFRVLALLLLFSLTVPTFSSNTLAETTMSPEEMQRSHVCMGICSDIQKLCAEDIAEGNVAGHDLKDGILDETSCLLMCEADWTDTIMDCVSQADSCAQFFDEAPYCVETEEEDEPAVPATTGKGCDAACKKYAKCAGYGDGVGPKDMADAYKSCMQICPAWTQATQQCIASTLINSPADCAAQTMCMFGSFKNMIPPNMPKKR